MPSAARREAIAFLCAIENACAEHRIPCPGGHALLDSHHRLLWDANHLRVETLVAPNAEQLADAADLHLGAQQFRMITLLHEEAAPELCGPLGGRGYQTRDRRMMMLGQTPTDVNPSFNVQWVTRRVVEQNRFETLPEHDGYSLEVGRQLIERDAIVATVVPERCFAALDHGEVVARCQVYGDGAIAQIEHVYTRRDYRRRGYGGAVVTHAARAARAAGAGDVFLLTDADWHEQFYARLGFVYAGRLPRFLKLLE